MVHFAGCLRVYGSVKWAMAEVECGASRKRDGKHLGTCPPSLPLKLQLYLPVSCVGLPIPSQVQCSTATSCNIFRFVLWICLFFKIGRRLSLALGVSFCHRSPQQGHLATPSLLFNIHGCLLQPQSLPILRSESQSLPAPAPTLSDLRPFHRLRSQIGETRTTE